MGIRTESKEIGGRLITVTQFPPLRACELAPRVAKAMAPALLSGIPDNGIAVLFSELTPQEVRSLTITLLECTTARHDGKELLLNEVNINTVFAGSIEDLFAAAFFSAEVNFGNFFGAASLLMREKIAAAAQETQVKESPSSSGSATS